MKIQCPGCSAGKLQKTNAEGYWVCGYCGTIYDWTALTTSAAFNQEGQAVNGTQTNISGNVSGVVLSGSFGKSVTILGDTVGRDKITINRRY